MLMMIMVCFLSALLVGALDIVVEFDEDAFYDSHFAGCFFGNLIRNSILGSVYT